MRDSRIRDEGLRIRAAVAALLSLLLVASPLRVQSSAAAPADRIWFCPSPGSIDYTELFTHPDEWPLARQVMDVFKFYQQHTQTPAPDLVGPNTYDAFVRVNAFRTLANWHKKIAIEAGSVKEFYCTPDASGMHESIANTLGSIRAVQAAGGSVAYIAMDEPFVSGRAKVCGGPALEPTADRVATYIAGVKAAFPNVTVGLIEAYPFSSEGAIETIVGLLKSRGAAPAFLHMDVNWKLTGDARFEQDMIALQAFCAAQQLPFGVIFNGTDGDSDVLYASEVYTTVNLLEAAFPGWSHMPDHLIVQSWAVSSTGLTITPANLPETRDYTHTALLLDVYRRLRGGTGPSSGHAVIRR
jgi:hypothetical protein